MNKIYHGFSHCSGVYKITNKNNGLVYFGQAVQLATRAMQHEYALVKNKHKNPHLQAAWNDYLSDAFEFEVIAVYPDKIERTAAEQALIDEHYGPGCYNIATDATLNGMSGRKHTKESKEKMSAAISAAMKGKKHSEQHILNQAAALKGKKRKPWTQDQKDAKSAAMIGKKHSPEACANIAAGQTGKKRSPEACAAQKAAWVKRRAAKALLASIVLATGSDNS